jgi:hypothetical protein
MRLALTAQSQCRTTLIKCLAENKNPAPLTLIKQTNIAHNQQVNNGREQPAHAGKTENQQTGLSTVKHRETLDTPKASTANGFDTALKTLSNRPAHEHQTANSKPPEMSTKVEHGPYCASWPGR